MHRTGVLIKVMLVIVSLTLCHSIASCLEVQKRQKTMHCRYFDFEKLQEVAAASTRNLNKIIDVNYYPAETARRSNMRHRPIGIGVQVRPSPSKVISGNPGDLEAHAGLVLECRDLPIPSSSWACLLTVRQQNNSTRKSLRQFTLLPLRHPALWQNWMVRIQE